MGESKEISIADNGKILNLSYDGLLNYHGDGAVFGATVGFRALQAASKVLSKRKIWDRKDLKIVSEHPGPGVRDAIEYVTRCVTRGGYELQTDESTCNSKMRFVWQVSVDQLSASVQLKDGFLPRRFFELLGRLVNGQEAPQDRLEFNELKLFLSRSLWEKFLEELFQINYSEKRIII